MYKFPLGVLVGLLFGCIATAMILHKSPQEPLLVLSGNSLEAEPLTAVLSVETEETNQTEPKVKIKLYFADDTDYCTAQKFVEREIEKQPAIADATLRLLFEGPTEAEKSDENFYHAFEAPYWMPEGEVIGPLSDYFKSVKIKPEKRAVVDFDKVAERYLNQPACAAASVMSPIIETLKQFPSVEEVEFSLDGEVITEWDA